MTEQRLDRALAWIAGYWFYTILAAVGLYLGVRFWLWFPHWILDLVDRALP